MNKKKILSTVLAAVMLFTSFVGLLPTRAEAAHSSSSVSSGQTLSLDAVKEIVNTSYKYGSGDYEFGSAQELLDYELELGYLDYVSSAGNAYTLYINRYTGVGYYVNNKTGEVLTTNPYNPAVGGSFGASSDVIKRLMSQIEIVFGSVSNSTDSQTYLSSVWSAEYAQISVSKISGGLRVSYTLGDTATRFLVPGQISAERFEELLLKPMIKRYTDLLVEYIGTEYPDEDLILFDGETWGDYDIYKNGCIDQETLINGYFAGTRSLYQRVYTNKYDPRRVALDEIRNNITKFVYKFSLKNPVGVTSQTKLDKMYEEAPLTKEGKAVYVFKGESVEDKRTHSNIIKLYCSDYSFSDMEADEEECGFVDNVQQKPVFRCSLEYTFNEDGSLSVRLPANSINFDETVYILQSVTPLPYFGVGDITDKGYAFIPDGSGSVIYFDEFYTEQQKQNVSLMLSIYGSDYCYSQITGAHREPVSMPVYGITGRVNSSPYTESISGKDRADLGYFAILEEGASLASLNLNFGGMQHTFASASTTFNPYPSDKYDLSDTISVGGSGEYTIVSESKYTGSYVTRYVMLSDTEVAVKAGVSSYAPTYVGMATYYRDYLKARGELKPLENLHDDLPLYIEALGSMEIVKKVLTFPVTVSIPLTTFEDVITMYDELSVASEKMKEKAAEYLALYEAEEKNAMLKEQYLTKHKRYLELAESVTDITNVNFRLTGFANGGMYFTYPSRVKWERVLGGKDGFTSLLSTAADREADGKVFGVYPEFDFLYMSNTAPFDGISSNKHLARMVDNRFASKQFYSSVLAEYETFYTMLISPDALDELYAKFNGKYSEYYEGDIRRCISVSTLGSDINSNFDEDNPINREESRQHIMELLDKISNDNGYSVMLNRGNIYSVGYADHILDICTDSSHYRYASHSIPFVGLVLHSYVSYTGGALNYSGSPDYDILHSIENGASLYYVLCYQNTNYMKDDPTLNKYYGVNYENWFDGMVEQYDKLNDAIGGLQYYEIVDHRVLIAERVIDAGEVAANNKLLMDEFASEFEEQLEAAVNAAFDDMFGESENYGRGIKLEIDVDAIVAQASDSLNLTVSELTELGFKARIQGIVDAYKAEYTATSENPYVVSLSSIEYTTRYNYVTDSFAEDEDYHYTDYTVDNNLVVIVTYRCPKTGDTVSFLLNYNIYSVTVKLDEEHTYTLGKYEFQPIND